jgi:hypothetical protein
LCARKRIASLVKVNHDVAVSDGESSGRTVEFAFLEHDVFRSSVSALHLLLKGLHPEKPHWDDVKKELSFRGNICLTFDREAENQQALLRQFELSGWPPLIDSPLSSDVTAQTLRDLNSNLANTSLRFGRRAKGKQITWRARISP